MAEHKLNIRRWDPATDGTLSEEKMMSKLQREGYKCYIYHYHPGTYFEDHTHEVHKVEGIIAGQFRLGMYGQNVTLGPGDMLEVPRGVVHNAAVVGTEGVIAIDASKP